MSFVLSKLFWTLAAPGNFLLLVLTTGLLLKRASPRTHRFLVTASAATMLVIASLPVGDWAAHPLEERFKVPAALPERIDGIVVLGGSVNPILSAARKRPVLRTAPERVTSAVALARRYPGARIVFTSASGFVTRQDVKEAPWAGALLTELGVESRRLILEDQSRNTFENVILTQRLVQPKPGEQWLLVTSAMHMPRSVGCFRRAQWPVIPYPVDFHTTGGLPLWTGFDLGQHLTLLTAATKEWIGLAAYRLLGRTSSLFPGPELMVRAP